MIHNLKPYPAYKDSGVLWLGEVPDHWKLQRMKTILKERSQKGFPDEPLLAATQTKGVVRKEEYENRTVLAQKDLHLLKLVRINDFVISLRSFQGGIEYAREQGIISPAYTILYPVDAQNHGFLSLLLKSKPYIENLTLFVTGIRQGQNIDYVKLGRSELPLPPLPEQPAIVRYLDYMDRRIRRYIRTKQKLIKLLEEQKQAIIHQAVTRGLDPNVKLKPSGVKWLGDVPEHWEVRQLGRFITLQRGFDITKEQQIKGVIPVVSSGGVSSYHNQSTSAGPGVIIGRKGSVGTVHFVEGAYWAHDTTLWVKQFNGNQPKFVYYVLLNLDLKRFDTGSANPTVNRNIVHPEIVAFPPIYEQSSISSSLDQKLEQNKKLIDHYLREISLLREYRTRLIADVVTGKLDVREAAANLPDEAEVLNVVGELQDDNESIELEDVDFDPEDTDASD
jgi:type I restriction enzyme, S subunit